MQATVIKHAQLLMGYMATEQEKVAQGIAASGFSKELASKQKRSDAVLPQNATELPKSLSNVLDGLDSVGKEKLFQYLNPAKKFTVDASEGSTIQNATAHALPAASSAPLTLAQWDQSKKLTFTDSMALNKVLAQLNFPAGTIEACNVAEDGKGSISLRELTSILDRTKLAPSLSLSDGKAALTDVQTLIASLQLGKEKALSGMRELKLKQSGSYNLEEFRALLKTVVHESAKRKLELEQELPRQTPYPQVSNGSDTPGVQTSASKEQDSSLTRNLAAKIVFSFPDEDDEKKRKDTKLSSRSLSLFA